MSTPPAIADSKASLKTSPIPRQCLEYLPVPVLVFESSLRTHFVNRAARCWFGLSAGAEPDLTFSGADQFFGSGIKLDPPTEEEIQIAQRDIEAPEIAINEFGAVTRVLPCYRGPTTQAEGGLHSLRQATRMRCAISTFLPTEDYFTQHLSITTSSSQSPAPAILRGQTWYIVILLGTVSDASIVAPAQQSALSSFGQSADALHAANLQSLSPSKLAAKSSSVKFVRGNADSQEGFFPPIENIARPPLQPVSSSLSEGSSSAATSLRTVSDAATTASKTPSSIFSSISGSTSTSSSRSSETPAELVKAPLSDVLESHTAELASTGALTKSALSASPLEDSPAARIIAQHRASESQRRRTSQTKIPQVEPSSSDTSPLFSPRPPLQRARPSGSSLSSLRMHSYSYSSTSSTTARHPLSEAGSESFVWNQDALPSPLVALTRAMLARLPQTGIIMIDKDLEVGSVNEVAFDMLTGQRKRRSTQDIQDFGEDDMVISDEGLFIKKKRMNVTPPAIPGSSSAPHRDQGDDSPQLGPKKLSISKILQLFLPQEASETSSNGGPSSPSTRPKKLYRVFDGQFSTRIIDPLDAMLDIVARSGENPEFIVGSDSMQVGIEIDVDEDSAMDEYGHFATFTEAPAAGVDSARSKNVTRKVVRRRVLEVSAGPLKKADGSHLGGVLLLREKTNASIAATNAIQKRTVGEGYFQQVLEHLPHLIWTTTPTGSHDYFNEQWYRYTGLEPEESLGLGWKNPFKAEDMPHTIAAWSRSLSTGEPYSVEYRCRRYDGVYRWMLGRANCLRDSSGAIIGWFGSCTDIEEAVSTRQELKRTQDDMDAILKGADLALANFDRDMRLKSIRGALGRQVVRHWQQDHPGPVIGQHYRDLLDPDAWEKYDLNGKSQRILSGKEENISYEFERLGSKYQITMTPELETQADGSEKVVGLVLISVDMSKLRTAERALEDAKAEHARSLISEAAAKEASQMKTEFLSTVNHELRTPLSAIMGLSELLLDDSALPESSRDYVHKIVRSSEALLSMIGSILDITKVEAGKLELNPLPFSLKEIIDEARILGVVAKRKGLLFHETLSGNVAYDMSVVGDFGRIRQILSNLLSNAIKFTPSGSITLNVNYEDLGDSVKVEYEVKDNGIGIKESALVKLFQPYQQVPGISRQFGGTGLGLYISQKLAHLMQGNIEFSSVYGQGTRALLTLRLRKNMQPSGSAHASPDTPEREVHLDRSKTKILIAEDNPVNREVVVRFLQKAGYSVESVQNGQEVLDKLEDKAYDLLIMDCNMPEVNGYEAATRIRQSPNLQLSSMRILALTASASAEDRQKCLAAGFNDYLTKPFRGKTLEKNVLDLLSDSITPAAPVTSSV